MLAGFSSLMGPITGAICMEYFGLMSFFQLISLLMAILAVISIYRSIFIPAVLDEFKIQSTLRPAATTVGTVLHVEEDVQENSDQ